MFLGYSPGYKGAICYSTTTRNFLISLCVIHDESTFPYTHANSKIHGVGSSLSSSSNSIAKPIIVQLPMSVNSSSNVGSSNTSPHNSISQTPGSLSQHQSVFHSSWSSSSLGNVHDSST